MTSWSISLLSSGYKIGFEFIASSNTPDFEIFFDIKHFSSDKFLPSLLPRWLYETTEESHRPAPIKKSLMIVLNLVCPDLKSFPAISAPSSVASLIMAGWKVFYGDPFK